MNISSRVIFFFKIPLRLSKIAGSKLTSNNPDIADLNDDNRPTKLAEKFGQVYDDPWTDAIEELTKVEKRLDDRAAIGFLLRIVMVLLTFLSLTSHVHSFIFTYYTCFILLSPSLSVQSCRLSGNAIVTTIISVIIGNDWYFTNHCCILGWKCNGKEEWSNQARTHP